MRITLLALLASLVSAHAGEIDLADVPVSTSAYPTNPILGVDKDLKSRLFSIQTLFGSGADATFDTLNATTINAATWNIATNSPTNGFVLTVTGDKQAWRPANPSVTVATLPGSPFAGQQVWASDVLTSRGKGDIVTYDGTSWRTMENVVATADNTNFIWNAWAAGLNVNNSSKYIYSLGDAGSIHFGYGFSLTQAGSGAGAGSGYLAPSSDVCGGRIYVSKGTTAAGYAHVYGRTITPASTLTNAFGGSFWLDAACDGTDTYWALVAMVPSASGSKLTRGIGFLYDMYNVWSHGLTGAATNHWIAWVGNGSDYTFVDTGLTPSTSGDAPDRLEILLQSNVGLVRTNGVLCQAFAAKLPTSGIQDLSVGIVGTNGTTARKIYWATPGIYGAHATRTMP